MMAIAVCLLIVAVVGLDFGGELEFKFEKQND